MTPGVGGGKGSASPPPVRMILIPILKKQYPLALVGNDPREHSAGGALQVGQVSIAPTNGCMLYGVCR
jgi:hypothetical protein